MRTSFEISEVDRIFRVLQKQAQTRTCQAVMHFAVALMANDPASTLSDVQRDWLLTRCEVHDGRWEPFSPHEQCKLVPVLLGWSAGTVWQDALISGLRGVVAEELLPEVKKE